jgi:hypothetical protein
MVHGFISETSNWTSDMSVVLNVPRQEIETRTGAIDWMTGSWKA